MSIRGRNFCYPVKSKKKNEGIAWLWPGHKHSASTAGELGRANGNQQPPMLPSLPTHLCQAGVQSKRRHWALIFLYSTFTGWWSYSWLQYWSCGLWLSSALQGFFFFFNHFIVNGVISECSCLQWLKSHYIFKYNYCLGSILTQYHSSGLHSPRSVLSRFLSEISKEAKIVTRCAIALWSSRFL